VRTKGTVARVNEALRKAGKAERLARGKGCYFYFRDGDAMSWTSSSVYTNDPDALTVEQWLAEYDRLSKDRLV
jgi:hypothetical protein